MNRNLTYLLWPSFEISLEAIDEYINSTSLRNGSGSSSGKLKSNRSV